MAQNAVILRVGQPVPEPAGFKEITGAASAIGKLASLDTDPLSTVRALAPMPLRDPHPQTQQYALKALKAYEGMVRQHLQDLDDLALNERVKEYVRRAAHSAAAAIREAVRLELEGARHKCARCGRETTAMEHISSQQAFQRTFCGSCFDEVFLDRRNFDTKVGAWTQRTTKSAC